MKEKAVTISNFELDHKRDNFAHLVASGHDIGEAYNTAFRESLSDKESFEKGKELCANEYVSKKIREYYEDIKTLSTVNRSSLAVILKRIADCDASDFFETSSSGMFMIKPLDKWTRTMKAAFKGIKFNKNGMELVVYDKISSINSLVNLMGWNRVPDEVNNKNELSSYTDSQLNDLISSFDEVKLLGDVGKKES
ncbi:MAG: terminase small subunit [Prevotella sp.]